MFRVASKPEFFAAIQLLVDRWALPRICPTGVGRRFAKSRRGCRHHLAAEFTPRCASGMSLSDHPSGEEDTISPSDGNRVGSTPLLMAWLNCEFAHCPPTAGGSKSVDRWLHERVGKQPHSNFAAEFAITFKLRFAIPLILQLVFRKVRIPFGEILDVCW